MMKANEKSVEISATCPACGLLCDDLMVEVHENGVHVNDIKVMKNGCEKSITFFEQPLENTQASIRGQAASTKDAVVEAARLLKQAKSPLFDGLSTDVTGFRTLFTLSQKVNAALKHTNSNSLQRNMRVLQSTGWQTTTLTEVKNHADVILCIGTNIVSHNPRFFERFVDVDGMFVSAKNRQVIVLGNTQNNSNIKSDALEAAWNLPCRADDLPSVTITLRALVAGKPLKATEVAGLKMADLQKLADTLKAAKYAVIAWVAKDLDFPQAELTIQNMTEMVATLNLTSRAAGLPLGGSDGDTTVNYANTWLSGFILNDEDVDHDVVVWVNSLGNNQPSPKTQQPLIALARQAPTDIIPEVFIPVATPGIDSNGLLFRVDGSVTLPLKKLRSSSLPTLSEIVSQIEALL
ncbi:MAG: formylmethanofuran dehydrogenase [Methylophilaceae bacterium]